MNITIELQLKARDALEFLRDHPAFQAERGNNICDGFWFMMAPCCKHGVCEDSGKFGVTIHHGEDGWEKFKDLFDEEYKEADEKTDPIEFRSVRVPYEKVYGELWVYDHMEYWYELTFYVFEGNPYNKKECFDSQKYGGYQGPMDGANSFEEMLISAAEEAQKAFGDFAKYDAFYTEEEKKNHDQVNPFSFGPLEKDNTRSMTFNDKYIDINEGLINIRWLEWFVETDYAKQNWEGAIDGWKTLIKNAKEMEPKERKEALAKYKT